MRRIAGVALALGVIVVLPLSARAQQGARVQITNNSFSPPEIHVPVGTTVTWTVGDGSHSVTADDGTFDSSPSCGGLLLPSCMSPGDTFEHQFSAPRIFTYHCRVHGDAMTGKVIVDAPSSTTTTTTTSTSTTSTFATTSTPATTTSQTSELPIASQAPLPSSSANARGVLPKSIIRSGDDDDHDDNLRRLALVAVGIAGSTTVVGIVLVRRGRLPLG